jgi:hypothetical protein
MRPIRFPSERLEALFQDATVATLPQLKAALGTTVDLTVFRKLSALPYRTPSLNTMSGGCGLTATSTFPATARCWTRRPRW